MSEEKECPKCSGFLEIKLNIDDDVFIGCSTDARLVQCYECKDCGYTMELKDADR